MASLNSAYKKVGWAKEHLAELKIVHDDACAAQAKATVIEFNPDITIESGKLHKLLSVDNTGHPAIPDRCIQLTGLVVGDLRTTLNYLVMQLAELDTPGSSKKQQFPFEVIPEQFKGRPKDFLFGLNATHIAAIEQLQPYNGCKWAANLSRFSNFDRHKDLIMVTRDQSLSMALERVPPADAQTTKFTVKVKIEPILRIALNDGAPLIETLEDIQTQVSQTLDAFQPEFE